MFTRLITKSCRIQKLLPLASCQVLRPTGAKLNVRREVIWCHGLTSTFRIPLTFPPRETVKGSANGEGNFFFSFLIPGTYQIIAEKTGFKRFQRDGIEVHVNDRLEVNIPLQLGVVSDTVTVTEEAPLLDTTSASVGRVVDSKEVRELPMNHGDSDNLIRLSGGVAFTDSPSKDQPWQMLNTA